MTSEAPTPKKTMSTEAARELMEMGISVLNPAPGIAARIKSAAHFKEFLLRTPLPQRKKAYEALTPHLKFQVLPYFLMFGIKRVKRNKRATTPHA